MARLISLSRAARLVGVKRGTLQQKIRAGELHTFEGELDLSELLRVYPQAKLEDSTLLEKADRAIEKALDRVVHARDVLPDPEILAARVSELSYEIGSARQRVRRYQRLLEQLDRRLVELAQLARVGAVDAEQLCALHEWLGNEQRAVAASQVVDEDLVVTDTLLRVVAAQVRLEPSRHEFFVYGRNSLLDAALHAGLAPVYGCTDGHCDRCRATLRAGAVKPLRQPPPGADALGPNEIRLCSVTAVTDLVLEATEVRAPGEIPHQRLEGRVADRQALAPDLLRFRLRLGGGDRLQFLAGQWAELRLAGGEKARLAIASCPCDSGGPEFHLDARLAPDFAAALAAEDPGPALVLEGPGGDFVLDVDSPRSLVFLAWDTGFAAVKALVEQAMALDVAERIGLHRFHSEGDRPYLDNLCRAWRDALDHFDYQALRVDTGRLAAEAGRGLDDLFDTVASGLASPGAQDFYLAGPPAFVQRGRRYLVARGVPDAQIRTFELPAGNDQPGPGH